MANKKPVYASYVFFTYLGDFFDALVHCQGVVCCFRPLRLMRLEVIFSRQLFLSDSEQLYLHSAQLLWHQPGILGFCKVYSAYLEPFPSLFLKFFSLSMRCSNVLSGRGQIFGQAKLHQKIGIVPFFIQLDVRLGDSQGSLLCKIDIYNLNKHNRLLSSINSITTFDLRHCVFLRQRLINRAGLCSLQIKASAGQAERFKFVR